MALRPATALLALGLAMTGATASAQLIPTHRVPAALAHEAVGAAVAACKAKGYNVTAAFVDASGDQQAMLQGDGAGQQTVQSAYDKANTSALFGTDSGVFLDRQKAGQEISPLLGRLPHLIVAKGGVVVKAGDEIVGGLAVGGAPGGQFDEACAREALAQIQDRLK